MSRFEEVINEAIDEVILAEAFKAETLAQHIAERVRDRQDGRRAEVTIAARYPETRPAPASARPRRRSTRCSAPQWPARHAPSDRSRGPGDDRLPVRTGAGDGTLAERLRADGFTDDEIARFRHGSRGHPQPARHRPAPRGPAPRAARSRGGDPAGDRRVGDEFRDLRADEALRRGEVVEKAHLSRASSRTACARWSVWPSTSSPGWAELLLSARQENLETIHRHNVVAERHGLLGELAH